MQKLFPTLQLLAASAFLVGPSPVLSQALPTMPAVVPGKTSTVNVSAGTRATLSIGTSNAFGTTASISVMPEAKVKSESMIAPLTGSIKTSLGSTGTSGGAPTIKADIANVRTSGGGTTNFDNKQGDTGTVTSEGDASFAEGSTNLTGMASDFQVDLDPSKTSFAVSVEHDNLSTMNVSNGQAAANINSNINIDISNTAFSSAFMQGF